MFQTLIRPSSGASEYLLCCVGWTTTDLFIVDREGLGVYDRLEQGVCIAWALFGNEFSVVLEGLDVVLFIWQE